MDTQQPEAGKLRLIRAVIGYGFMVAFTIGVFLLIRSRGESLVAPPPVNAVPVGTTIKEDDIFIRVLVALAAIIVLGQMLARLFVYLSQPPVIGEVVAGILLGPSLLGPDLSALVLPTTVAPFLGVIAQLGVVLYMFLVGLEINPALLKQRAYAAVATSHASILFPFVLGAGLALFLYPRLSTNNVAFTSFALFMGVAMSITAFPVLARILTDYRMSRTRLGVMALSCAAVGDVTAWCLLAFVVGVAKAQVNDGLAVVAGALAFISFMFLVVRPVLTWLTRQWEDTTQSRTQVIFIFVALFLSAIAAETIGIHAIFGAFLLGAMIPHESDAARTLTSQLERVVTILLLPAFFAFAGMRTRIDLLSELNHWLICGLIVLVATVGKFGSTLIAARITGQSWREAAILGTLMNTRGLMELIVLNVGLDLGIITPTLFSIMVVMALVTTALTSPVLRLLKGQIPSGDETDIQAEFQPEPQSQSEALLGSSAGPDAEGRTSRCT
jgi:Kef-type K+ transport system membrane component KefB